MKFLFLVLLVGCAHSSDREIAAANQNHEDIFGERMTCLQNNSQALKDSKSSAEEIAIAVLNKCKLEFGREWLAVRNVGIVGGLSDENAERAANQDRTEQEAEAREYVVRLIVEYRAK